MTTSMISKIFNILVLAVLICILCVSPVLGQDKLGNETPPLLGGGNDTPPIEIQPTPTPDVQEKPVISTPELPISVAYNEDIPIAKRVVDPVLITNIRDLGMNPGKVMLVEDYTVEHPTAQKYQAIDSGQMLAAISTLPRIAPNGQPIVAQWAHFTYSGSDWTALNNLFTAEVQGTEIKAEFGDQRCWWNPELYLDGQRIYPVNISATLVDDKYNPNYHSNILAWDYGICVRELRLIEGSMYEKWVFKSNPGGQVIVKHRQGGSLKIGIGEMADSRGQAISIEVQQNDWEIVNKDIFNLPYITYPLYLSATLTFNMSTAVLAGELGYDIGWVDSAIWSTIKGHVGNYISTSSTVAGVVQYYPYPQTPDLWKKAGSSAYIIDTSSLNDAITITSATFSLFGLNKSNLGSDGNISMKIYSTTTGSNNYLASSDYELRGSTAYTDAMIHYNAWSTTGYNTWTMNAAGLAAISKTGYTKIAVRDVDHDVAGNAPTWYDVFSLTDCEAYMPPQGTGYEPQLVVTYTPSTPVIATASDSSVSMTSARLNSQVTDDGGELCAVRFGYGNVTQTAVNFESYTTKSAWSAYAYATGNTPYLDVSSLTPNMVYYYRAQIKNTTGNHTSVTEETFTTLASLQPPTNLVGVPSSTSVLMTFAKGYGAENTVIRYAFTTYPGNSTAGSLAGNTTGTTVTHSGLTGGQTVYYSAYSTTSAGNTSTTATYLAITTLLASVADPVDSSTSMPEGFSQTTDATVFSKLPGYGGVNEWADAVSIPRASVWLWLQFLILAGVTLAIALVGGATLGIVAGLACGIGFVVIGGIPSGYLMILGLFAVAFGLFKWRTS